MSAKPRVKHDSANTGVDIGAHWGLVGALGGPTGVDTGGGLVGAGLAMLTIAGMVDGAI